MNGRCQWLECVWRSGKEANPRRKMERYERKNVISSKRFLLKNGFNLVDYNTIASIQQKKWHIKNKKKTLIKMASGTHLIPFDKLFAILKRFGHFDRPERYVCSGWWYRTGRIAWTALLWICSDGGGRRWWRRCFWWRLMLWWLLLRFRCKCWCCHFCIWISHRRTVYLLCICLFAPGLVLRLFCVCCGKFAYTQIRVDRIH